MRHLDVPARIIVMQVILFQYSGDFHLSSAVDFDISKTVVIRFHNAVTSIVRLLNYFTVVDCNVFKILKYTLSIRKDVIYVSTYTYTRTVTVYKYYFMKNTKIHGPF